MIWGLLMSMKEFREQQRKEEESLRDRMQEVARHIDADHEVEEYRVEILVPSGYVTGFTCASCGRDWAGPFVPKRAT